MEEIIAGGLLFLCFSKAGAECLERVGGGREGVEVFQRVEDQALGARRLSTNILPLTHTINSGVVNMMPHTLSGQMLLLLLKKEKKGPIKTKSLPLIC